MIKLTKLIVVGVISLLLIGSTCYTPKPEVVYLSRPANTQLQDLQLPLDLTPRIIVPAPAKPSKPKKVVSRQVEEQVHLDMEITAYTFTGNNTATGVPPRVGLVAVDPRVIPLGSRLRIEGYGEAVAADTGGDIKGNRIDVFLNSRKECIDWGRRKQVRVEIIS